MNMAKGTNRLKAGHLKKKGPAKICDGGGLWLFITQTHARRWVFRYRFNEKNIEIGLGGLTSVSMDEARQLAQKYRALKAKGIDPKHHKQSKTSDNLWTFDRCAKAYIEAHAPTWSNAKHSWQWDRSLEMYASPYFGHLPVDQVNTTLVVQALEPIWQTRTETASRVRGRIEKILSWAIVRGYRNGPNPAVWRGHLDMLLAAPSKIQRVQHQPAMPYQEVAAFITELKDKTGMAAQALQFLILTATRTSEVIAASWDEIDGNVWTIPAERMKARRPHRVPLSGAAVALLDGLPSRNGWLFPSIQHSKHISNRAMLMLMRGMEYGVEGKRGNYVTHGFRSSFRDWCAEQTNYPRELAESALAHVLTDKTEAAYQRGDMLEKRSKLMQAWADYCHMV
jgi:integrase